MDAGRARHMLSHIVDADIHEFHRIEGASPQMRRCRRMGGAPAEVKIDLVAGQRDWVIDACKRCRMPGYRNVDVVENSCPYHEALGGSSLLGRTAVVADASLETMSFQIILHGS